VPVEVPPAPPPRPSRALLGAIIIVLLVLVAAGGALYHFHFRHPASPKTAIDAFNANDLDGALAQLDAQLAAAPRDVTLLVQKSFALAQKGSLEFKEAEYGPQAAAVAEQAIGIDANSSEAYRALGYANEIQQKYDEAHAAYEKAVALDPKNALALFGDAHAYDLQGDLARAEAGYQAALAADPKSWQANLGLGRIYNANGDASAALAAFKAAYADAKNVHDQAQAAYSVSMLLLAGTDIASARSYSEQATALDPSYPSAWFGLGTVLYAQAVAVSPSAGPALSAQERASLMLDSVQALQKATALNPNQSVAYFQLGEDLYVMGKRDFALAALKQAAAVAPADITLSAPEKDGLLKQVADFTALVEKQGT
jgi:superkiller protein 3